MDVIELLPTINDDEACGGGIDVVSKAFVGIVFVAVSIGRLVGAQISRNDAIAFTMLVQMRKLRNILLFLNKIVTVSGICCSGRLAHVALIMPFRVVNRICRLNFTFQNGVTSGNGTVPHSVCSILT